MKGTSSFAFRLVVLIGLMIILAAGLTVLLNQLKFAKVLEVQQARVARIVASDLAETFEQSIALGVRLAGVPGGQVRLDRRRAADASIARLAVLDATGRILFDTDRRHIGETAPAGWTDPRAGGQALAGGLRSVAAPIQNSFRQTDGTLVLFYDLQAQQDRLNAIAVHMLRAAALALVLALPVAALAILLVAAPTRRWFAMLSSVLAGATVTATDGTPIASELREAVTRVSAAFDRAEAELEAEVIAGAATPQAAPGAPSAPALTGSSA